MDIKEKAKKDPTDYNALFEKFQALSQSKQNNDQVIKQEPSEEFEKMMNDDVDSILNLHHLDEQHINALPQKMQNEILDYVDKSDTQKKN